MVSSRLGFHVQCLSGLFLLGLGNEWRLTFLDSHVRIVAQYRFQFLAGMLLFVKLSPILFLSLSAAGSAEREVVL